MGLDTSIQKLVDGNYRSSYTDITEELISEKDKILFFQNLEDDDIRILLDNVVLKKFMPNELIFTQGEDKDEYIYYIISGNVRIMNKSSNGLLSKVTILNKSTLLGEMKPILQEGRTATCISGVEGTIVIGFMIKPYQEEHKAVYEKFYKNISEILLEKIHQHNPDFALEEDDESKYPSLYIKYKTTAYKLAKTLQEYNLSK